MKALDGSFDGWWLLKVGVSEGLPVGTLDDVGLSEGFAVGFGLGFAVGFAVGVCDGVLDGLVERLGVADGSFDG